MNGGKYVVKDLYEADITGKYELKLNGDTYNLEINKRNGKRLAKIVVNDTTTIKVNCSYSGESVTLRFVPGEKEEGPTKSLVEDSFL